MYYLLRKQIILIIAFIGITITSFSQRKEFFRADHDDWNYYFGMSIGYNVSSIHPTKDKRFLADDSVLSAEPGSSGGVALGLLGTLRLNRRFELRANPQLILGGAKYFTYSVNYPLRTEKKTLPSTIVSFPFQLKFNSDRINNFRMYMLGGIKYDMDLASNSSARNAEDLVKLNKSDFGYEIGVGFNFYMRFVTFSPEIKLSNGLSNVHSRDAALKYSSIFDKLQSRMVQFSIILED